MMMFSIIRTKSAADIFIVLCFVLVVLFLFFVYKTFSGFQSEQLVVVVKKASPYPIFGLLRNEKQVAYTLYWTERDYVCMLP